MQEKIEQTIIPQPEVSMNENMMYLMSHNQPENDTYSSRIFLRWFNKEKPFNDELFTEIINFIVNRHEIFRTIYFQDQRTGFVHKKILKAPIKMVIPVHKLPYEESDPLFLSYCKELGKGFFPLVTVPQMRMNLVYDINQVVYLVTFIPHIIMDAYSNALVLCHELTSLYFEFREKPREERTFMNFSRELRPAAPFSEYVKEEKEVFAKKLESAKRFYRELYKSVDLNNKFIAMETEEKKVRGIFRILDKTKGFKEFAEKNSLIESQIFYAIFQISLLRCLNLRAVPISKLFQNRKEKFEATMGFFAHELIYVEEIKEDDTLEKLYHRNKEAARNTIKNFGDISGLVVARLLNLPLPRFKYNYLPKTMTQVASDEVSYISEPDFYDTWNWEGELFKVKFGFIPYDFEDFVYLTYYHSQKDFPNDVADSIADAVLEYSNNLPDIWQTKIKNLEATVSSLLLKSKL